jgi:diadenosine tetraphosphate (Ap4A) HIT family hydrolase
VTQQAACEGSDLCDELRGAEVTSFSTTYKGNPTSRKIYSSEHLHLIADLSPLVTGHMLLIPVDHVLNFGHVITDSREELEALLSQILPLYRKAFGRIAIVEHGSSSATNSSACITHAHWHLLPVNGAEMMRLIEGDGREPILFEDLQYLAELAARDLSYLYCFDDRIHKVYAVGEALPRQYPRSVAGRILGIEDPLWDWAITVRKELLRDTIRITYEWRQWGGATARA